MKFNAKNEACLFSSQLFKSEMKSTLTARFLPRDCFQRTREKEEGRGKFKDGRCNNQQQCDTLRKSVDRSPKKQQLQILDLLTERI